MTNQKTWTTQELELIDDAFCDIIQDLHPDLAPAVELRLTRAIDRLRRGWREQNGYTA